MHNVTLALDSAWRVLLVCLLFGAGLPALFAAGIRVLARPARPLAYACFTVVLLGVALGITLIVASGFGQALSFEHVYPTLTDK
ncbi:hypothetical protein [Actinoplanes sp. NPDC049265]|uniref:hypothetical protein n=1 Tax=Actinoplanes sp. NPDC049265 TaxID=3363902 RepID=UPI00371E0BA4